MPEDNFILPVSPYDENEERMPVISEWNLLTPPVLHGGEDGKLHVDVVETENEIIVVAAMAGTTPEDLELHLQNDLLTIRGKRVNTLPESAEFHHKETFWGKFSRTIVLPTEVKSEMAQAEYKYGILTIKLPKLNRQKSIPITVVEE